MGRRARNVAALPRAYQRFIVAGDTPHTALKSPFFIISSSRYSRSPRIALGRPSHPASGDLEWRPRGHPGRWASYARVVWLYQLGARVERRPIFPGSRPAPVACP